MSNKRPRDWSQFSFRTLLLVLTLMCVWLGFRANRARQQAQGRRIFRDAGASVELDPEPRLPWIDEWLGADFVHEVGNVTLPKDADDQWLAHLKLVRTAHSLSIVERDLSGSGFIHLRHLRNLTALTLDTLPELQPEAFTHVSSLTKLESLTVSACPAMTDSAASHLAALGKLQSLALDDCPIGDKGLEQLRSLRKLRVLSLARTKVTDAGIVHIAELPAIERLTLFGTAVTDECLPYMRHMKNLRFLDLIETKVTVFEALQLQANRPELELRFGSIESLQPPDGPGDASSN